MNWVVKVALLAALGVAASASPATAAVTIGQTGTPLGNCAEFDRVQPSVISGTAYVVPSTGGVTNWTVSSWSTQGGATAETMTMKVYRPLGGVSYQVVGHDGPRAVAASILNTFQASFAVKAGDILGDYTPAGSGPVCTFSATGETYFRRAANLADGAQGDFVLFSGDRRLNISAQTEPTNTFTQGATTLNKKKGNATVAFTVPNPGTLTATGTGVSASSAGAHTSATVAAPGTASLLIKASGKKKRKLRSKGKVTLSPTVTFTPNGGTPGTLAASVKLKIKK